MPHSVFRVVGCDPKIKIVDDKASMGKLFFDCHQLNQRIELKISRRFLKF
jgi:hypothetical protein